ncbi:MAG: penicillin-binding protein 2 [Puniceicoccales bacterium]|jgi:cell division protein FtsI/penicillin-binding protein 2|nr:penicillin-binding protein 2 [Puniceicoccales bacterium]
MLTVSGATLLCFVLLLFRLTYLMLFSPVERLKSIDRTRHLFAITEARRGGIYDRHGVALAVSIPTVEVGVDPKLAPTEVREEAIFRLAEILKRPAIELESALEKRCSSFPATRWVRLADAVPDGIFQKIRGAKLRGVYGNRKSLRSYPQKNCACHVVGFVNRDGVSCCGVENFADFFLRGQDGWILSEKDGRRRELRQFRAREVPSHDGSDVYLTIDLAIQKLIEDELARIAADFSPKFALIIVGEAETGKILALACHPSYDPNCFFRASMESLRNRAICDCYEPGSVFKIVTVAAGLEEGIIDGKSVFDCSSGSFEWRGQSYHLPSDHSSMGQLSLADVLRKSSNRGSAQIAIRLGPERFYSYVRAFGFGERSGYGFDGEVEGILNPPSQWDGLTITRMPMGHAIAVTPMQMHMAMGVIASDGYLFTPRIVERISMPTDAKSDAFAAALAKSMPRRRVVSRGTVMAMRAMLHNPGDDRAGAWTFACKTGTSQKIVGGRYVHDSHVASCSGFFPAERPKFLVTVVVDSPNARGGTGWGAVYAKPSFKRIAEELSRFCCN